MTAPRPNLIDGTFFATILIKCIGGLVELLAGTLLIFVSLHTLQHDLGPATRLGLLPAITGSARLFAIIYFCLRGSVRVVLALALLSERLWAYPISVLLLGASVAYQIWLLVSGHFSFGLVALTILDGVTASLTGYEYGKLRQGGHLHITRDKPA